MKIFLLLILMMLSKPLLGTNPDRSNSDKQMEALRAKIEREQFEKEEEDRLREETALEELLSLQEELEKMNELNERLDRESKQSLDELTAKGMEVKHRAIEKLKAHDKLTKGERFDETLTE